MTSGVADPVADSLVGPQADRLADGRVSGVEFVVFGSGDPVTVFAHGLAGSVSETKPLAMAVPGTRVLFHFRGHGNSAPLTNGWNYELLAEDLRTVADHVGATGACGLSLGSGALLRLLSHDPQRFDRLAFVMPAALNQQVSDGAVRRLADLRAAKESQDLAQMSASLLQDVPAHLRDLRVTQLLVGRRAA